MPDRNDEYLFYQTLIGAWPLEAMGDDAYQEFCGRIQRYMQKAVHEAKAHTSWVNPSPAYDQSVQNFVEAVMERTPSNRFLEDFLPFQERVARYGLYNSLGQLLLKITAPGVPDFYQGTELWSFHLVDPDNRCPVDYRCPRCHGRRTPFDPEAVGVPTARSSHEDCLNRRMMAG